MTVIELLNDYEQPIFKFTKQVTDKVKCSTDEVLPVTVTKPIDVVGLSALTKDDEYEVVEADTCDDGEWVDSDDLDEITIKKTSVKFVTCE